MPRLIILLLALVSLALLAVQNLATTVALVVLSNTLPEVPLGILLVSAIGVGALLTLILYGLVGVRRPPESKYRPMGRRVPYPEGPGTTLPSTGPSTAPSADTSYSPTASSYSDSSSSAFVSEPAPAADPYPATAPQDTPPTDSYSSPYSDRSPSRSNLNADSSFDPEDSPRDKPRDKPRDNIRDTAQNRVNSFAQQPIAGIKSVFSKKKDRSTQQQKPLKPVGDDWGQRRTTEHKNTWELDNTESKAEEGIKGLVNFGRNVGANAGRLAEDISTGWGNSQKGDRTPSDRSSDPASYRSTDGYESEQYYADDSYYSGNRSDDYAAAAPEDLDQGWENFDNDGDAPPREEAREEAREGAREIGPAKQVYGDSLYGEQPYPEEDAYEGPYEETDPDEGTGEIGPDGVYEADYRVIVPPSKPLDSD